MEAQAREGAPGTQVGPQKFVGSPIRSTLSPTAAGDEVLVGTEEAAGPARAHRSLWPHTPPALGRGLTSPPPQAQSLSSLTTPSHNRYSGSTPLRPLSSFEKGTEKVQEILKALHASPGSPGPNTLHKLAVEGRLLTSSCP